jgi:YfiH family protein
MLTPQSLRPLTAACLSNLDGINHGFFTRAGGVSTGIYAGLNCGFGSNDDQMFVAENRARVASHLDPASTAVLTVHQVHSALAVQVSGHIPRNDLPKADAAVTATPGLVLGALAADCTPVLFADPVARVIAAAHAGWRGATGGILEATVDAMEALGARRENIRACVGPCINQASYEVGADFEQILVARDSANTAFFARFGANPKPHFDLPGFVLSRLEAACLGAVERQSPCTYKNESEFFSYRRATHRKETDYGRQISAIVLA